MQISRLAETWLPWTWPSCDIVCVWNGRIFEELWLGSERQVNNTASPFPVLVIYQNCALTPLFTGSRRVFSLTILRSDWHVIFNIGRMKLAEIDQSHVRTDSTTEARSESIQGDLTDSNSDKKGFNYKLCCYGVVSLNHCSSNLQMSGCRERRLVKYSRIITPQCRVQRLGLIVHTFGVDFPPVPLWSFTRQRRLILLTL